MNAENLSYYEPLISFISKIKREYDYGNEGIVEFVSDCSLDESFEIEGYEHLECAAPFTAYDYIDQYECGKYYFSSKDITEYYKLAYKIGELKGWRGNNKYCQEAFEYDLDALRIVDTNGCVSGTLYMKTRHKYASGWLMYIHQDFYDYWAMCFAIQDIFHHYKIKRKALEREYKKLLREKDMIMEVAA